MGLNYLKEAVIILWRNPKITFWLAGIAVLTRWIFGTMNGLFASGLIAFPAAIVFAAAALKAGPPYGRHAPPRWAWRIRCVPKGERQADKRFGRLVFIRIGKFLLPPESFAAFRCAILMAAASVLAVTTALPFVKREAIKDVPQDLAAAVAYEPAVSTRVYSSDGERICAFTLQERIRVPVERVPPHVKNAFVAAEDQRFYGHGGIDPMSIWRAAIANYRGGTLKQGGSTLTQQVVKQVVLRDNERSVERKVKEIFLAVDLERKMGKDEILEVYLNQIFLGHGAYGIQAAAQTYFGKDVTQLTVAEAAMLAGLPKAPSRDSPYRFFERAKTRQAYVLGRMEAQGFIDAAAKREALSEEIAIIFREDPINKTAAPYFCEHVRKELLRMYGEEVVFKKGLTVYSTLDMRMQRAAEAAMRLGLIDLERRLGFNGPEGRDETFTGVCGPLRERIADNTVEFARVAAAGETGVSVCVRGNIFPMDPADVERISAWESGAGKKLAAGDTLSVRIITSGDKRYALSAKRTGGAGHPEALQGALIAVDPRTGELKAMVGGYDYIENQFNNATQARRQTGSSVKPYVYLTSLMRGTTVNRIVTDRPVCYGTATGPWCPKNYAGKYLGAVDLRTAMARSLNSVSVQLLAEAGVDETIRTMRSLGITSRIERVMPISVGAAEMTLWEHTYAYAAIASGGREMPRHPDAEWAGVFFTKIEDENGKTLFSFDPKARGGKQVIPAADAYALTYLMRGVVEIGTGRRVRELRRPAAGKTGTTNDFRDAWFLGFTPDYVAGVWVGRTAPQPIAEGATGGSIALPIWLAFMKAAHPDTPPREFPVPADISLLRDDGGALIPFQRGRIPASMLSAQGASSIMNGEPF